jgi:thiol-disulfide isomerase/thioredoxin
MKKYTLVLLSFVFIVSLVFIASCQKTVTGETDKSMESNANKPVVEKTTTTKPEIKKAEPEEKPKADEPTSSAKMNEEPKAKETKVKKAEENASSKIPAFQGVNLVDGKNMSLADMDGYVLIIDFWAPWCPPCRSEIPGFIELHNKYKGKKFAVVGIAISTTEDDVKKFIADQKVNYPMIMGTDQIRKDYEKAMGQIIQGIPTTLIINRNGEIAAVHVGADTKSVFENEIQKLL